MQKLFSKIKPSDGCKVKTHLFFTGQTGLAGIADSPISTNWTGIDWNVRDLLCVGHKEGIVSEECQDAELTAA